jgi:arylsulfatase A-like enzyme
VRQVGVRLLFAFALVLAAAATTVQAAKRAPNVILVVADDLGYGDLGAYGHPVHRTPNLDRLASEGQRWTDFYSTAAVCTPSRGSLLTGRLPARLGLEGPRGTPNVFLSASKGGLPRSEVTLAERLAARGYATALIGKWHLGYGVEHSPLEHGFEYFFGTPSSNDHDPVGAREFSLARFFEEPDSKNWDVLLYRDRTLIERPAKQETLTHRLTDESVAFIRRHRDRPFFLMLSYTMPHVPLFASPQFRGKSRGGLYADVIEELDSEIGRLMSGLRDLGLSRDTVLLFTSDNGPIELFRDHGGSPGPLRGGKNTTWEAGMRVPGIFWGPGRIAPGVVRDIGSQLDVFPTVLDLVGGGAAADGPLDGGSLRATLAELAPGTRDRIWYYRNGEIYAVREGRLKAHFVTEDAYGQDTHRITHDPPLIFDLASDPGERFALEAPPPALIERFRELRRAQTEAVPLAPSQLGAGRPNP